MPSVPALRLWRSTSLLPVLAVAILALACGDAGPQGEPTGRTFSAVSVQGVDYSWYRPSPSSLAASGYKFVVRYASYDTTGKNLSKSEADALLAAGLDIVDNWENGSQDALSGYNLGVSDAKAADQMFAADGAPSTRPIYFSIDFDASVADQTAINAYFDGVASVIGVARTGAYGGYYPIQRLFDAGKIKFGWQTYAWSGGQWEPRAQLRQVQNGIAGGQMDLDESEADDFGQWGPGAPSSDAPRGYLDSASCATVTGWTQDPAVATSPIFADLYYGGPAGASGATGIRLTADISRPDLCTAIGSCDHGYSMPLPRALLDGKAHDVYAYGINHTSGGTNTLLTGSPKSITCAAPAIKAPTVKRHVTTPTVLTDWRLDTFEDMAPYSTAEMAAVPDGTDLASGPDVVQASGNPAVYVVDSGHKRHIVDPASMTAWRLTSKDIKPITAAALAALTDGPDWPATPLLAKDPTAAAVYLLDVPFPSTPSGGDAGAHDGGSATGDAGGGVTVDPDGGTSTDDGGAWNGASSGGSSGGCSVARPGLPASLGGLPALVLGVVLARRRRRVSR